MKIKIANSYLEIIKDDITKQDTQAIVNAANHRLSPGGGVAGAIHRAAGPQLWEECKTLGGCKTTEAKITSGYKLPAKYVIHTVGPVYRGDEKDSVLLEKAYKNSLKLAEKNHISSVSFPALSTGVFGYPIEEAARIALETIIEFLLKKSTSLKLVRMVLYDDVAFEVHKKALEEILKSKDLT